MNVASIQAPVQLSQHAVHHSEFGKIEGFATFLQAAKGQSSTIHNELRNGETISDQDVKDLLALLTLETGSDINSLSDWLNGEEDAILQLDSLMFVKEEDIPFELFAFLQNVTAMNTEDLLSFLTEYTGQAGQIGQMDIKQVASFETWAQTAAQIELSISKGEAPNVLKILEMLKMVELAGSRLSLPAKEAAALEHLQQSLGKIRENLEIFLKQSKKQPLFDRILESYQAMKNSGNELTSEKLTLNAVANEKLAANSGLNESSVKAFEGNLSFLTQIKQPIVTNSQTNTKPVSFEQFTEMLTKMIQKSSFSHLEGTQKLLVKLHPEHLGTLRIELVRQDGIITAKLLTSTQAAKELIESQLQGFRNAMGQAVQIDKIEVIENYTQPQERSFYNKEQEHKQQSGQQQNKHKNNSQSENEQIQFQDVLFELIV
ncbi:flagellar hook-length control protein FliK [Bacillus oleivorans]|uniref:Flagellar hook-length control protein FliK n=1 Tax=Bacillus oleivorans TaxID=1448271 RepID=A0A285D1G9_9BACI|nr:flagellar hook-length control protein FliK [Bacillus oleivorans]SNX73654.1 flagellar hook-length control protein FliK [Bacillus oleivorans]